MNVPPPPLATWLYFHFLLNISLETTVFVSEGSDQQQPKSPNLHFKEPDLHFKDPDLHSKSSPFQLDSSDFQPNVSQSSDLHAKTPVFHYDASNTSDFQPKVSQASDLHFNTSNVNDLHFDTSSPADFQTNVSKASAKGSGTFDLVPNHSEVSNRDSKEEEELEMVSGPAPDLVPCHDKVLKYHTHSKVRNSILKRYVDNNVKCSRKSILW